MHTIEITSKIDLTNEDIDDLMSTAFEGGINYWVARAECDKYPEGAKRASQAVSRGGVITLVELEPDDEGNEIKHHIGIAEVLTGIKHFCEDNELNPATLFDPYMGDYDAGDADSIIQYACFGEVIYG